MGVEEDVDGGCQFGADEGGQRRIKRPTVSEGRYQSGRDEPAARHVPRRSANGPAVWIESDAAAAATGASTERDVLVIGAIVVTRWCGRPAASVAWRAQRRKRELFVQDGHEDDQSTPERQA